MAREARNNRRRVSVWSWMWTILALWIPGVNIIVMFLLVFLSKSQPKRSFAAAALWLMLILAVLTFAAFMLFPGEILSFAQKLEDLRFGSSQLQTLPPL